MNLKVIVLDIDGTLFDDNKQIMPQTKQILLEAQKQGIRIVLASGRPAPGLWPIAHELEMDQHHGLLCCMNGAQIIDVESQEVLFEEVMSNKEGKDVLEHTKQFDVSRMIYNGDDIYVEDPNGYKVQYEANLVHMNVKVVDNLTETLTWDPLKILLAGDPEYLQAHFEEIKEPFDNLNSAFTAAFYYEFTKKGIDKAKALGIALSKLGLNSEQCISFGDAGNDLTMIQFAGLGVAMGNASDDVKEAADMITTDNNHEGIYEVLKNYVK